MSEESFAQMLDNEEWKEIRTGEVVDGRVIAVKPDRIVLNIGGKSDGIITRSEYTSAPDVDLTTVVSVGDEMKAKVLKSNDGEGQVALTYRKLVADNGNKKLEDAFNNQEPITGVAKNIKGGLEVIVDEARVFIPASLISDTFVKDLSVYNGKEVTFVITEYDPKNRKIIGDCKQLIVAAKKAAAEAVLSKIKEGDTIEGTVKNVTDFGAFIDLGGVDGLLCLIHLEIHVAPKRWNDSSELLIELGCLRTRARDDERCTCFVDKNRVDLIYDGKTMAALNTTISACDHVVAQIIETEF